jgi:hypothetical protein
MAKEIKLTFDEALERINEERPVYAHEVLASALRRKVWVAEWHIPGCLSESRSYCLTKADAIEAAVDYAHSPGIDDPPRGMKTALRKAGFCSHHTEMFGRVNTTVDRWILEDLLDR